MIKNHKFALTFSMTKEQILNKLTIRLWTTQKITHDPDHH